MGRSYFPLVSLCEKKDSNLVHKMVPTEEGSEISFLLYKIIEAGNVASVVQNPVLNYYFTSLPPINNYKSPAKVQ